MSMRELLAQAKRVQGTADIGLQKNETKQKGGLRDRDIPTNAPRPSVQNSSAWRLQAASACQIARKQFRARKRMP